MNHEQTTSLVRQAMLFIAGMIAGTTFVSKFFTYDQVVTILTSETVIGLITSAITAGIASAWALVSRSDKNLVKAADEVPSVAGVIMKPTIEGSAIAAAIPNPSVTVSSTPTARAIAGGDAS